MKVLALELSSSRGSIAFRDDAKDRFTAEFANDRKHSGLFFENLQHCVRELGAPERIVVGLGPGSYAGTRIAIAAAIGLQAATGAQLRGVPSISALPSDALEYSAIGDARRQSFFFARVRERRCVQGPELCSEPELRERLSALAGPIFASEPLSGVPAAELMYPSAIVLAEIASDESPEMRSGPLEPIYLREPHITRPKSV